MPFFIIMYLLIVHECGHFFSAMICGVKVNKICIYPFGGISKFDMDFNISQFRELVILTAGPLLQLLGYLLLIRIPYMYSYIPMIKIYNYSILFFNLLPIYPLDGGKLLNIIFSFKFSFKNSYKVCIIISYLVTCLFLLMFINNISINVVVIFMFLIYKITFEYRRINYFYEKFLLERYLNKYNFHNSMIVDDVNKFHRNKKHLVKNGSVYYTEKEILEKKYKKY